MSWLKDPTEVLDYRFEWSELLEEAETLTAKTTVATPAGLTVDSDVIDETAVVVWLSGGALGNTYEISCTVTTSGGRTLRRIREMVVQKR